MNKIISFFGAENKVFTRLNQQAEEYAATKGLAYAWSPQKPYNREQVIKQLQQADAGIIDVEPYNDEVFARVCGSTRLLVRFGVGYDKVDLPAATRRGIAVARTTGANTLGVAEMAMTLILTARRRLRENAALLPTGNWAGQAVCHETVGATVGIVGFGAIGQALAGLLQGFSCRFLAYDPYADPNMAAQKGVELTGLDELFRAADAVSLHLPYSQQTHHIVGERLLSLMKPTAVLVNTARGGIIDEEALYRALSEKRIAGAALDVFEAEPLPTDSPLLGLDNIVLTPHVSSQTVESLWRIYKMAIDIACDFFADKGSPHILNPDYAEGLSADGDAG